MTEFDFAIKETSRPTREGEPARARMRAGPREKERRMKGKGKLVFQASTIPII